jgi:hypothetical protein
MSTAAVRRWLELDSSSVELVGFFETCLNKGPNTETLVRCVLRSGCSEKMVNKAPRPHSVGEQRQPQDLESLTLQLAVAVRSGVAMI